ncbi:hypothetical protein DFH27DRAFT_612683 [Peziza echinospora]|nr:hypothetical protein DFH27DRAFT_612683 [Peziza echinospora]
MGAILQQTAFVSLRPVALSQVSSTSTVFPVASATPVSSSSLVRNQRSYNRNPIGKGHHQQQQQQQRRKRKKETKKKEKSPLADRQQGFSVVQSVFESTEKEGGGAGIFGAAADESEDAGVG